MVPKILITYGIEWRYSVKDQKLLERTLIGKPKAEPTLILVLNLKSWIFVKERGNQTSTTRGTKWGKIHIVQSDVYRWIR